MALPPPIQVQPISLPATTVPVLDASGQLTLPWRKALQSVIGATGSNPDLINKLIQAVAALTAELAATTATADEALTLAEAAEDQAALAEQLAIIASAPDPVSPADDVLQLLMLSLAQLDGSGATRSGSLVIKALGVIVEAAATSLDFEGTNSVTTDGAGNVTVTTGGYMLLVNGDLPGPSFIADASGQPIAVPYP